VHRAISVLLAATLLSGCLTSKSRIKVETRPQGLEVQLMGYRFLLHNVYALDIQIQNAGDGMLYKLNDVEILVITGREVFVDGKAVILEPGARAEILPGGQVMTAPKVKENETAPTPESVLRRR